MNDATGKNFGLLIAFVLPGFVTLWGLQSVSPAIQQWLLPSPTLPAGLESMFFILLASITAGMTVSALRWSIIDSLHHFTGLKRPDWDDSQLPTHLIAFDAVVDWHYRHYQFYANMAIALPLLFISQWISGSNLHPIWLATFFILEGLFIATSRDTLRKYYARTTRLLGTLPSSAVSINLANESDPTKSSLPEKPLAEAKKPAISQS